MQDGLDANRLLHQEGQRLVAHACRGAGAVGNVDGVDADRFNKLCAFDFLADIDALGRDDLDHGDKFTGGEFLAQTRSLGHGDTRRG